MKTKNTRNNNTGSFGKIAALILVLLFITINHYRVQKDIITKEEITEQKEATTQKRNTRNQLSDRTEAKHIEKLKFAYTGKWAKNEIRDTATTGEYSFTTPDNTRSLIKPTSMKKEDKKKKKVASKKTKKTNKVAKSKRNFFHSNDSNDNDGSNTANYPYANNPYYNAQQPQQERAPSDDEKDKRLTAQEWLELIIKSNSISELVTAYKSSKVSQSLFHSIAESLLSSSSESSKKLGFQALSETPSLMSFSKTAKHLNDQMSTQMKTFAQSTLEVYEQPNQLRVLNSALNSKDVELKILAASIIKTITTSIVQAQASSGENVVYSESQLKIYTTLLTQSLNVINAALETGIDATVVASFTATRTILVQFLS